MGSVASSMCRGLVQVAHAHDGFVLAEGSATVRAAQRTATLQGPLPAPPSTDPGMPSQVHMHRVPNENNADKLAAQSARACTATGMSCSGPVGTAALRDSSAFHHPLLR